MEILYGLPPSKLRVPAYFISLWSLLSLRLDCSSPWTLFCICLLSLSHSESAYLSVALQCQVSFLELWVIGYYKENFCFCCLICVTMLTSTSPSMISCLLPSLKQTYPLLIISVRLYSITVGFFKNLLGRKLVRNVLKIQAHLGLMFQRKAEIVRDFLGHLVQTLLKQGHLEP